MFNQIQLYTIIFSKDRALQLDSLIRSIKDHYSELPHTMIVLYATSDQIYDDAYELLKEKEYIADINWIKEQNFAQNIGQS